MINGLTQHTLPAVQMMEVNVPLNYEIRITASGEEKTPVLVFSGFYFRISCIVTFFGTSPFETALVLCSCVQVEVVFIIEKKSN